MDIYNYPNDTFNKFLFLILIHYAEQNNEDIDDLKEFVNVEKDFKFARIPFRGYDHNGVRITFISPYINKEGNIVISVPYVPETSISRLMFNLGCKGLMSQFSFIRTKLLQLAPSKHSSMFNAGGQKLMKINTPLMRDMANGRLVFKTSYVPIN